MEPSAPLPEPEVLKAAPLNEAAALCESVVNRKFSNNNVILNVPKPTDTPTTLSDDDNIHNCIPAEKYQNEPMVSEFASVDDELLNSALHDLSVSGPRLEDELDALAAIECQEDNVESCLNNLAAATTTTTTKSCAELPKGTFDFSILDKILSEGGDEMNDILSGMLTHDILGEPMRALVAAYEPWLRQIEQQQQQSYDSDDVERYREQAHIYSCILKLCEETGGAEKVSQLQKFMTRLQILGEPPQPVLDAIFSSIKSSSMEESDLFMKNFTSSSSLVNEAKDNQQEPDTANDYLSDDIEGFTHFLKGLGLSGAGIDTFLDPELLRKAVTGEISEDALADIITANDKTNNVNQNSQNNSTNKDFEGEEEINNCALDYESSCRQM